MCTFILMFLMYIKYIDIYSGERGFEMTLVHLCALWEMFNHV